MSDFRTKLLGLTALAIATAGLSSAQTIITCLQPVTGANNVVVGAANNPLNPATLRLESQTELVQDVTTQGAGCNANAAVNSAIVYVTLSATVTSKLTNAQTGQTEAALVVTPVGGVAAAPIFGVSSGTSQLTFNGVNFPMGNFNFEIYNVRVDAATSTNANVTESVNIEYVSNPNTTSSANLIVNGLQVGFIQQSLGFGLAVMQGNVTPSHTYNNYMVCAGNPLPLTSANNYLISTQGVAGVTNLSFLLNIAELTPGAFKQTLSNNAVGLAGPVSTIGGENGSYIAGSAGVATGPTTIVVTLANVPSSATVYLPYTTTSGNVTLTLANTSALTGAQFQPNLNANYANLPFPNSTNNTPLVPANAVGNVVGFPSTNGGVTATYVVTQPVPVLPGQQTFAVPVEMVFAKNSASAQTTPVSVLVAYGPSAAPLTGPASGIPTFAVSSAPPINASVISPCATTLLFPYVSNYQGTYETGIAISNTTTDNLGAGNASAATATPGTCTLWFYGNSAVTGQTATGFPTGTIGAFSSTQSPTYATTLSTLIGAGSTYNGGAGFTGYAIAYCNFLEAHGFAFLTDYTPGGNNAFAQGYLAVVVPNGRNEQLDGAVGHLTAQ